MEIGEEQREEAATAQAGDRRLWAVLFAFIAISLWTQWLGAGALAELRSEDGSSAVLALQILPLMAMGIALMWRHEAARLALVPVSFLPGLAMMADAEWAALTSPGSLTLSVATFAVYLVVAASRPRAHETGPVLRRPSAPGSENDGQADFFRRFVVVRFAVMGILFVLVTYGLFFDESTKQALAALDGDTAAATQHVFMVISMYFAWIIAVYMGAILPALNWEYHRRRSAMPAGHRRLLADSQRLGRRVFLWLTGLLIVVSLSVWFLL